MKPLLAALFCLIVTPELPACNVPVFRYALERWTPDECEIVVFHASPLSAAEQTIVSSLQSFAAAGEVNAEVVLVDLGSDDESARASLWRSIRKSSDETAARVLVRTRTGQGQWVNHFQSPLSDDSMATILQSPSRRDLTTRLLTGDSVVWLMLASADEAKNVAARELIGPQLESLATKIELPEGIGLPGSELYAEVPLLMQFTVLEIAHDDARESFLRELLTGFQPDAFASGEPLFVPVFGRGRALEVIPASSLDAELIENLTRFLSAACSCQVKEQNPGFDLLIAANWEVELYGTDGERPADRSTEEGQQRERTLLTIPPGRKKASR